MPPFARKNGLFRPIYREIAPPRRMPLPPAYPQMKPMKTEGRYEMKTRIKTEQTNWIAGIIIGAAIAAVIAWQYVYYAEMFTKVGI